MQMRKHFARPQLTHAIQYQLRNDRDWSIWGLSFAGQEEVDKLIAWLKGTGTYYLVRALPIEEFREMEEEKRVRSRDSRRRREVVVN